jgi:hypothetical protein
MKNKQQSIILAALILSIAIYWLPSVANGNYHITLIVIA